MPFESRGVSNLGNEELNNMPRIKEIADGGANPNTPSLKQMRESQQRGAEGNGASEYTYAEKMAIRNHGTGQGSPSHR